MHTYVYLCLVFSARTKEGVQLAFEELVEKVCQILFAKYMYTCCIYVPTVLIISGETIKLLCSDNLTISHKLLHP